MQTLLRNSPITISAHDDMTTLARQLLQHAAPDDLEDRPAGPPGDSYCPTSWLLLTPPVASILTTTMSPTYSIELGSTCKPGVNPDPPARCSNAPTGCAGTGLARTIPTPYRRPPTSPGTCVRWGITSRPAPWTRTSSPADAGCWAMTIPPP